MGWTGWLSLLGWLSASLPEDGVVADGNESPHSDNLETSHDFWPSMNYNCSGEAGRVGNRRKPDLWSPRVVYKPLLSGNATATWSTVPVMHSASLSKVFLTSVAFSNPHSIPWVDKGQDCIYPFYRYGNSLMMIMWLGQGHIARRHENQAWNPVTRASIFFHDLETVVSIPLSNSGHFRVQFWEVRQVLGNTAGLSVSTQSCQRFKGQQVSGGPQQVCFILWMLK